MKKKSYTVYFGENALLVSAQAKVPHGYIAWKGTLATAVDTLKAGAGKSIFFRSASPENAWRRVRAMFGFVKAAGGWVQNPEGRILLIFRRGKWDLPKGKQDAGESLRRCALREVEEECGVTGLTIVRRVHTTYHVYFHKRKWMLKSTAWYAMDCRGWKSVRPQMAENITRVRWMTKRQRSAAMKNSYASIRSVVAAAAVRF